MRMCENNSNWPRVVRRALTKRRQRSQAMAVDGAGVEGGSEVHHERRSRRDVAWTCLYRWTVHRLWV